MNVHKRQLTRSVFFTGRSLSTSSSSLTLTFKVGNLHLRSSNVSRLSHIDCACWATSFLTVSLNRCDLERVIKLHLQAPELVRWRCLRSSRFLNGLVLSSTKTDVRFICGVRLICLRKRLTVSYYYLTVQESYIECWYDAMPTTFDSTFLSIRVAHQIYPVQAQIHPRI